MIFVELFAVYDLYIDPQSNTFYAEKYIKFSHFKDTDVFLNSEKKHMNEKKEWKYCVVGNIVKERIDENGVLRHGTAAFRGGAKVYLCGKEYDFGRDSIDALGLSRGKRLQVIWTPREQIENLRLQKVYRTGII